MSGAHKHEHTPANFNSAFAIGIALNVAFVAIEAFYGWKVNSLALLADAGHNLSDVLGLILAWVGVFASKLRPNSRHTYGWKRATILAAFANALLLLVAMGSLVWEAIGRLNSPTQVQGVTIMVVASIGVLINSVTAWLFMRGGESDLNIRGAFLHMAADAMVSLGVVIAGALALWFGWAWIDPVSSLLIAAVILLSTSRLFRDSLHLLFDGVPWQIDPDHVRHYLEALPGVVNVHDLHIWAMSTSQIAMTVHLVIPEGHPGDQFLEVIRENLHEKFEIEHATIQIELNQIAHGCEQ
ncbi:MAG: cation diffusion facilitator family transporter [Methylotenera sp.]|nr:cation diffusion facilitator family transporter [Methylotenera sp.]